MSGKRAERTRQTMIRFAGTMLAYPTIAQAADAAGISPRTASRWLRSTEFKAIYADTREATLEATLGMLRALSVGACEALGQVVRNPDAAPTARTNAARSILDSMLRLTELQDLDKRLKTLEEEKVGE